MVVEVVRRDIAVPSVTVEYLGDDKKVAHLKLLKFAGDTDGEWETAVKEIIKSGADRIVLDLRNNPGGYLQMAVDISGDFLPNGTVAVIEESSNGSKNSFKTSKFPRLTKYPVVVLVNEGSASASEILAGALRDMASVKLVGDTSFGKGTIQEPRQLEGGAGIHITIAKWLTPNGTWVNEKGLDPDVKIADNVETSEDEQLLKALEVVKSL
jgi:carboxyl-terminal processing protease